MDQEFYELMTKEEPLHPDLQPFVRKSGILDASVPMLHSPLLIELFLDEKHCGMINHRYGLLKKEVAKAREENDWHRYVFWHERPYRLEAFLEIEKALLEGSDEQANLFRAIWTDSENIWENYGDWGGLWTGINREAIMTPEEQTVFAAMPDPLTIYRGINHPEGKNGLSWTPDCEKAEWFAKRFQGPSPTLLKGQIAKEDVLAYFDAREIEVVVFPENVQNLEEISL